ncbi:glycoside hydrolase superfamily [Obelidium mucronatum]|nr:glycoside hydrolase superfamily [Obelidium mucronatum]
MHLSTLALAAFAASSAYAALYEPADGQVILGAWVDTEAPKTVAGIGLGGDSPAAFNRRLGKSAGVFHLAQTLPLGISPASLNPFDLYTDADIKKLATQLDNISDPAKSGRRVMLRFAPEMNGNWFSYGNKPARFVKEYKRIVDAVRAVTKRVSFVWAPNAAKQLPIWSYFGDDPFTPYWPGADYVDWVGLSLYWKGDAGTGTPPHDNSANPANYWEQMVQGGSGAVLPNPAFPFYDMFAKKYNKPLMMPEGGAAFAISQGPSNVTLSEGVGRTAILKAFWSSYLNALTKFPKAKMFVNFEFVKILEDPVPGNAVNNGVNRDFRITWDASTLAAFKGGYVGSWKCCSVGGPVYSGPRSTLYEWRFWWFCSNRCCTNQDFSLF